MLLIDGVKYELWTPPSEDEFERVVEKHAEEIFGKDAKYFDLKHKLASRSGTGSIPDGYVITLGDKPEVQIIELELASHSLQHIVPQMVNIMNGIENPTTQQKICNAIEDGINGDEIFAAKIVKAIKPQAIHRFLSDSFSNRLPIINIIIDKSSPVLQEAISKITPPPRIIEFQTFTREGTTGLAVHAHLFEPIYTHVPVPILTTPPPKPAMPPIVATGMQPSSGDELGITIRNPSFINFHLFYIPKGKRQFFPGYKVPFTLETDIGEVQTHVASARAGTQFGDPNAGYFFQANLAEWYRQHPTIRVGDRVKVKVIEPMKRYRLEVIK